MAFAAAIGPIIGAVASLAGSVVSFAAMSSQAKREEEIAAWNAARQREKASLAQAKGASEARQKQEEGERAAGLHRATVAAGGASTTEGTPLLMQAEFARETWFNSEVAMFNAKSQQADLNNQANITEYEGKLKAQGTRAQAVGSLIGGFSSAAKGVASSFG